MIKEFGLKIGVDLRPDANQSCRLDFGTAAFVQIDLDATADQILIGSNLGRLNPGPYREQVLKQALRANYMSKKPRGTLGFSERNDTLILFQYFPLALLTADKLSSFLTIFQEYADVWGRALKDGGVPALEDEISDRTPTGFMGLR